MKILISEGQFKLLSETFSYEIRKIKQEDLTGVLDTLYDCFKNFVSSKEDLFKMLEPRLLNNISICLEYNNKIVGVYLLHEKSINLFISEIKNNKIKDFPFKNTEIILEEKLSDNGLQGIALCVKNEYRSLGFGKKLKEYTYKMGYDYIWGVQAKDLNNISFWQQTRRLFAESPTRYATFIKL